MSPDQFIAELLPAARACHRQAGIPASFTIAQAALESGWGASKLTRQGCNLFGVKADKSWAGPVLQLPTYEFVNGKRITEVARWRSYPDWRACIQDRAVFFRKNPRYAACLKCTTGEAWARAVQAAGYATDPEYAAKLISVIRRYSLDRFDQDIGGVAA